MVGNPDRQRGASLMSRDVTILTVTPMIAKGGGGDPVASERREGMWNVGTVACLASRCLR